MSYDVTYRNRTASGGWSPLRYYKCKDGRDFRRIVDMYHEGKIKLVTVNGRAV